MEIDISLFGKGAIRTPEHIAATKYRLAAQATPIIDWSKPFSIENGFTLTQRDQKSSSSCTSQATGYYLEALERLEHNKLERFSARFIYSQSYISGGGAYIWRAMGVPLKGAASADSVPDGDSTEKTMTDASMNAKGAIEARADKYAMITRHNIDQMAQIVIDYGGFITGFNGNDVMFLPDGTTQVISKVDWGHCVYVVGFEMRNGKKCLKFKNSWTELWADHGYGYFPEEFVNSGLMFDAYVYADIADLDPNMVLTAKQVKELQALEGYFDQAGIDYWSGKSDNKPKTLDDYLAARIPDKVKTLQASQL